MNSGFIQKGLDEQKQRTLSKKFRSCKKQQKKDEMH